MQRGNVREAKAMPTIAAVSESRHGRSSSLENPKGMCPVNTLISDFGFHRCDGVNFYCFWPPVCGGIMAARGN